eukprot:CAMPEP_0195519162 /NCGR_PEP_ID=MMETSP0794_2-20130614/14492_1 /TAXON_ID=515487 /ORGANISM="Stephanopyxis turris, Strain CCMP 815" /LENGTH=74 /DNA_ID=CAMNT_0040648273 /DNA_START=104 /DNA_END=328 /DNA_ORIENTATION=+
MAAPIKLPTDMSWFQQDEQVFETAEARQEYYEAKYSSATSSGSTNQESSTPAEHEGSPRSDGRHGHEAPPEHLG